MQIEAKEGVRRWNIQSPLETVKYKLTINSQDRRGGNMHARLVNGSQSQDGDFQLPDAEPDYVIVPFLSRRKVGAYSEDVRDQQTRAISPDFSNLAAKLLRLSNRTYFAHNDYYEACQSILGFVVTSIASDNGQRPGLHLPSGDTLPIDQMGEGVPNIVSLLASLVTSKDKIFLIEEPENDLHPKALKALLDLIVTSAKHNQFVVSTHSNIVVRHLCSAPSSKLFRIAVRDGTNPIESTIRVVPPTPQDRLAALQELGYSLSDVELWDGWLIFEESSAERIVRDYLIRWFAPRLSRLRTFAANGVNRVEPLLDDFQRLVVFAHLEPIYKSRTWVRLDGDSAGIEVAAKLRNRFKDWPDDRIQVLNTDQFELTYPAYFSSQVAETLAMPNGDDKRAAKQALLKSVISWLDEDEERGKSALERSAASLIEDLQKIDKTLFAGA